MPEIQNKRVISNTLESGFFACRSLRLPQPAVRGGEEVSTRATADVFSFG